MPVLRLAVCSASVLLVWASAEARSRVGPADPVGAAFVPSEFSIDGYRVYNYCTREWMRLNGTVHYVRDYDAADGSIDDVDEITCALEIIGEVSGHQYRTSGDSYRGVGYSVGDSAVFSLHEGVRIEGREADGQCIGIIKGLLGGLVKRCGCLFARGSAGLCRGFCLFAASAPDWADPMDEGACFRG